MLMNLLLHKNLLLQILRNAINLQKKKKNVICLDLEKLPDSQLHTVCNILYVNEKSRRSAHIRVYQRLD